MTEPHQVARVELAPGYTIARVIHGGWQLTPDHGQRELDRPKLIDNYVRLAEAGFTTFDCADIYTGVESLLGDFLRTWKEGGRNDADIQIHTKYVPDLASLPDLSKSDVIRAVDRSLARLGVDRLDLVQFHWWNEEIPGFADAASWLAELQAAGKIRCLGLTNVGVEGMAKVVHAGVTVAANQVQYSLLDRRPEHGLAGLAAQTGSQLLCYGSLAGGFLAECYLGTAPAPGPQANRSLTKYRLIVDEYGGWDALQELLATLAGIAEKHRVSLANVAARWVLERSHVAAIIVGTSQRDRLEENRRLFAFQLDEADILDLDHLNENRPGPAGDIYALERDPSGPHWGILRTSLHTPEDPSR